MVTSDRQDVDRCQEPDAGGGRSEGNRATLGAELAEPGLHPWGSNHPQHVTAMGKTQVFLAVGNGSVVPRAF